MDEHPTEPWRDTCVYCKCHKKLHQPQDLKCLYDTASFKAMKKYEYQVMQRNERLREVLARTGRR